MSGQHHGLKRVVWPWPLNMWPWKSIGIIYSLRATPASSLVLINWRGHKILSGQHMVYRPTDWPTDRHTCTDRPTVAKQYAPSFKGGIKITTALYYRQLIKSLHIVKWNEEQNYNEFVWYAKQLWLAALQQSKWANKLISLINIKNVWYDLIIHI